MATRANRIIYASTDILISDSPAAQAHTSTYSLKRIDRVQESSITISNNIANKKHIGYDDFLYNTNYMPPTVACDITYVSQNNSNELVLGLNASGVGIYSGLNVTGTDKNLFFLFDTGTAVRDVTGLSNFNGVQVLALGNAYITNYSCSAAVGALPSANVSFAGSNVIFQDYDGSNIIPSLESGNITSYTYTLASNNFRKENYISNFANEENFIRPGDITLELEDSTEKDGGVRFVSSGKIQNYQINIPFERRDLVGFGSDYPFERQLMYPSVGELSMNVIFDGFNTGNQTGVIFQNQDYNFKIKLRDCDDYTTDKLTYSITGAKLVSQQMATQIGESFVFQGAFTFPITESGNFAIDGVCRFS